MSEHVRGKRILLTGGAGFLGSRVRERLEARGAEVFVPRRRDYDLTEADAVAEAYEWAAPDTVVHLAAEVGGIGANRDNPGRFFYANMAMGLNMIEQARRRWHGQVRPGRHGVLLPQAHAGPVPRETTSGTATRRRPTPPTAWPRRRCW